MIERQLHKNKEGKMTKTPIKKTKKCIFCLFCFMIKNCYNKDDIKKSFDSESEISMGLLFLFEHEDIILNKYDTITILIKTSIIRMSCLV